LAAVFSLLDARSQIRPETYYFGRGHSSMRMAQIELKVNGELYTAELLEDDAPESIAAMREFLPLESSLMHGQSVRYGTVVI